MAGHSRSKNGVASLAYVPAIHDLLCCTDAKAWMPAFAGMTLNFHSSWPGLSRPSTSLPHTRKAWMPALAGMTLNFHSSWPGMTGGNASHEAGGSQAGEWNAAHQQLHPFASASRLRKAASPASDTATHVGSGAASGTYASFQFHHLYGRLWG